MGRERRALIGRVQLGHLCVPTACTSEMIGDSMSVATHISTCIVAGLRAHMLARSCGVGVCRVLQRCSPRCRLGLTHGTHYCWRWALGRKGARAACLSLCCVSVFVAVPLTLLRQRAAKWSEPKNSTLRGRDRRDGARDLGVVLNRRAADRRTVKGASVSAIIKP